MLPLSHPHPAPVIDQLFTQLSLHFSCITCPISTFTLIFMTKPYPIFPSYILVPPLSSVLYPFSPLCLCYIVFGPYHTHIPSPPLKSSSSVFSTTFLLLLYPPILYTCSTQITSLVPCPSPIPSLSPSSYMYASYLTQTVSRPLPHFHPLFQSLLYPPLLCPHPTLITPFIS